MRKGAFIPCAILTAMVTVGAAPADTPGEFDRAFAALHAGATAKTLRQAGDAALLLDALGAHPVAARDPVAGWRGRGLAVSYRERVLGPGYLSVVLEGGGSYHMEQAFLAGQRARVVAFATAPGAFDLTVRDDDGVRRCGLLKGSAQCDWVPIYTSRVSIALENRERRQSTFFVMLQ